jgi:8-oxo-dGTP diphosphatase
VTKVFLVRHAAAGDREAWTGDDRARPLSPRGLRQAAAIAEQFDGESIGQILSSAYLRCVETVLPLARALGLEVREDPRLAEGSDWREAIALVTGSVGPTVLCSQGDVIGDVVGHLVGLGLVKPSDAHAEKASTWVLEVSDGTLRSARYVRPPAG